MKVIFLGTNGWYDTKTGSTTCTFIDSKQAYIVLDAGLGLYKIDQYIKNPKKPIYLFISHFHLDHIYGLHILPKFEFKQRLAIISYNGFKKYLEFLLKQPFSMPYQAYDYKLEIIELTPKTKKQLSFLTDYKKLFHSGYTLGYRFKLENKIITYCSDTGICPNSLKLAKNADLLIHECSLKKITREAVKWGHTDPVLTAKLAKKAQAKKLALIHFAADEFLTIQDRKIAENQAKKIFPNTIATYDDLQITI